METSESTRIPLSLDRPPFRFSFLGPFSLSPSLFCCSLLPCFLALLILLFLLSPFLFLSRCSSLLPLAKVQRRGLPVADDQRGFPFSTPCCCCCCAAATAPPPFSSLPSSSLFSRALGTTGMIILRGEIRRGLRRREREDSVSTNANALGSSYPRGRQTQRSVEPSAMVVTFLSCDLKDSLPSRRRN